MEEIKELAAKSIDTYFKALTSTGGVSQANVNNLITLLAIKDLLDKFSMYISDKDLGSIMNALYCVSGNCIVSYPITGVSSTLFNTLRANINLRRSESSVSRYSMEDIQRSNT